MLDACNTDIEDPEIALSIGLIDDIEYKKLKEIQSWKIIDGRVQ